jgi:hypothetical protein
VTNHWSFRLFPQGGSGCCHRNRLRAFSKDALKREGGFMTHIDIVMIQPLVALLFGILILILPRLLNYLIAIYLILIGLTGLFPHLFSTTT